MRPVVYKTPIGYQIAGPTIGAVIACGTMYLGFFQPGNGADGSNAPSIFFAASLAWLLLGWLPVGSRVELRDHALVIVNPWGVVTIPVRHIDSVQPGSLLTIEVADGRRFAAWAVQASPFKVVTNRPNRVTRIAAALSAEVDRLKVDPGDGDAILRSGPLPPFIFMIGEVVILAGCILGYVFLP